MQTGESAWRSEGAPVGHARRPAIRQPRPVVLTPCDVVLCVVPISLTLAVILWFCRS